MYGICVVSFPVVPIQDKEPVPPPIPHSVTADRMVVIPGRSYHVRAILVNPRDRVVAVRPLDRPTIAWRSGEVTGLWEIRLPNGELRVADPTMLHVAKTQDLLQQMHLAWCDRQRLRDGRTPFGGITPGWGDGAMLL